MDPSESDRDRLFEITEETRTAASEKTLVEPRGNQVEATP